MKQIFLMGATGSIGSQTLDIIRHNPDKFSLFCFSFHSRLKEAREIIESFAPKQVIAGSKEIAEQLQQEFPAVEVLFGLDGLVAAASASYDIMVNAVMGSIGLKPTLAAIAAKKEIALANKETLVMAGDFVMKAARENGVVILPVDSEHSAIFQVMQAVDKRDVKKLMITASGGSFRDKTRSDLLHVTKEDALNHPNWSMGAKITIDSSTMVNKGLEVIEAHHLFAMPYEKIEVIQHRESIVHSMIGLNDGAVFAQMGASDMREPIQFALSYPYHLPLKNEKAFDLTEIGSLHFEKMDFERFPMLALAMEVGKKGGSYPAVYNAANEVAVAAFLEERISYLEIETLIEKAVAEHIEVIGLTLDDILAIDQATRQKVEGWILCKQ